MLPARPIARIVSTVALAAVGAWILAGCATRPEEPPTVPLTSYVRTIQHGDGAASLEVALRRLAPVRGDGPAVWLAGVTHLGTTDYFEELQRFLEHQTVVLFEGVGATNRRFQLRQSAEFSLQQALARAVGLEFQLDAINYDRPHFHNSDLSVAELSRLLTPSASAEEASDGASSDAPQMGHLIELMQGSGVWGGLARLTVAAIAASPRLQTAMRLTLVELLGNLPADLTRLPGLTPGLREFMRVLIAERNRVVVQDLAAVLRQRPHPDSVAVFYGAGHMIDLEQRLCAELNYHAVEERWLRAFDVNPRAAGLSQWELDFTRRLVRAQLDALAEPTGP